MPRVSSSRGVGLAEWRLDGTIPTDDDLRPDRPRIMDTDEPARQSGFKRLISRLFGGRSGEGRATVVGVHPVEAAEPCHLIELTIEDAPRPIDVGRITQRLRGQPRSNWQVPWDEHFLDPSGQAALDPDRPEEPPPTGVVRVAFFFHYLDVSRPLLSPWGKLTLPPVSDRPPRLAFLTYESP